MVAKYNKLQDKLSIVCTFPLTSISEKAGRCSVIVNFAKHYQILSLEQKCHKIGTV